MRWVDVLDVRWLCDIIVIHSIDFSLDIFDYAGYSLCILHRTHGLLCL